MHSGNQLPIGRHHVEHPLPRRCRGVRIGIEFYRHLGPGYLDIRHMHDIAPDQQRLLAGRDHVAAMSRGVPVQKHRGDARKHLDAAGERVHHVVIGRHLLARTLEIELPCTFARPSPLPRRRSSGAARFRARPVRHWETACDRSLDLSVRPSDPGACGSAAPSRYRRDRCRPRPGSAAACRRWGEDSRPSRFR